MLVAQVVCVEQIAGVNLNQTNRRIQMKTLVATLTLAALIASPIMAQAAPRSQAKQSEAAAPAQERTCGFTVYQYDSEGTPTGPYCH
jgi:hypothetical protein